MPFCIPLAIGAAGIILTLLVATATFVATAALGVVGFSGVVMGGTVLATITAIGAGFVGAVLAAITIIGACVAGLGGVVMGGSVLAAVTAIGAGLGGAVLATITIIGAGIAGLGGAAGVFAASPAIGVAGRVVGMVARAITGKVVGMIVRAIAAMVAVLLGPSRSNPTNTSAVEKRGRYRGMIGAGADGLRNDQRNRRWSFERTKLEKGFDPSGLYRVKVSHDSKENSLGYEIHDDKRRRRLTRTGY